jgi:hypothetical protein
VSGSRLIPVRVGGVVVEAEAVLVPGTEPTSGRMSRAAGEVAEETVPAAGKVLGGVSSAAARAS